MMNSIIRPSTLQILLLAALYFCAPTNCIAQVRISFLRDDTLKGRVKTMAEYRVDGTDTLKSVYTCDLAEGSETAVFYRAGKILLGKWVVKFDSSGRVVEADIYTDSGMLCQRSTDKYDMNGRIIEWRLVDKICHRCNYISDVLTNEISEWGGVGTTEYFSIRLQKYEYDIAGRLVKTIMQKSDSGTNESAASVEIISYRYYGSSSKIEEMKKENFNEGNLVRVETRISKYNSIGNKVEEGVLDQQYSDMPLINLYENGKGFTMRTLFRYDAHNNLVEEKTYFSRPDQGLFSKTSPEILVGTSSEYAYDSLNKMTSQNSYDLYQRANGSEQKKVQRTWKAEKVLPQLKEYDSKGNIIKITEGTQVLLQREIEYF